MFLFLVLISAVSFNLEAQSESAFDAGEWFKFEMSYSGFFKAGYATIEVKDNNYKGTPVYHIIGKGWTTGPIKWFFKVEDRYETFIDKERYLPYKFIRKIDEGGHIKNIEIEFDQSQRLAHVHNKKKNTQKTLATKPDVQDMVSTFYYLRNKLDIKGLKKNDEVLIDMFFDEENYAFKLKYLGEDVIETEFGKVATLKFRPYVMAGRVFKEEESLTLWVSNDKNKLPLRVQADLAVGSLRADLLAFKGLIHPFNIIMD